MSHITEIVNLIDLSIEEEDTNTTDCRRNEPDIVLDIKCGEHDRLANETKPSNHHVQPLIPQNFHCGLPQLSGRESLDNNPFDSAQKEANLLDDPFEIVQKEAEKRRQTRHVSTSVQNDMLMDNLLFLIDDPDPVQNAQQEQDFLAVPKQKFTRLESTESNRLSSVSSIEGFPSPSADDSVFANENSAALNNGFITENSIKSDVSDSSQLNKAFMTSQNTLEDENSSSPPAPAENSDVGKKGAKSTDFRKRLLKLSLSNSSQNSPLNIRRGSRTSEESSPILSSVFSEAENFADQFLGMACDSPKSFEDSCDDLMSIKPNWIDSETDIDSDLEMMNIPILQEIASPIVENKNSDFFKIQKFKSTESPPIPSEDSASKHSPDLAALREKVKQRVAAGKTLEAASGTNSDVNSLINSLKNIVLECSSEAKREEANNLFETLNTILSDKEETKDKLSPPAPPQPITRQGTFDIDLKDNDEKKEEGEIEEAEEAVEGNDEEYVDHGSPVEGPEEDFIQDGEEYNSPPEMNDIVEQIGKLLGNQNVNVVQGNFGTPGRHAPNPTYIVVMGTPLPSNKYQRSVMFNNNVNDGSPELNQSQMRRRSQSLSIHDKSTHLIIPKATSPTKNDCRTPLRPGPTARRNSFSTPVGVTPSSSTARRSIYGINKETVTKPMTRRSVLGTHAEKPKTDLPTKSVLSMKPEFHSKKLKLKSNETVSKPAGPLKATIPIKKVAPMIVTPSVSSPIEDILQKQKGVTSTPIVTITAPKAYPNACSTPGLESSPAKGVLKPKPRYSYISTTPNAKANASSNTQFRRRTLSEIKSPKKSVDSIKPTSGGITRPLIKNLKLPHNFSKTLNKFAPSMGKTTKGLKSTPPGPEKNKENNTPRIGM